MKKVSKKVARLKRIANQVVLAEKMRSMSVAELSEYIKKGSDNFLRTTEWKTLRKQALEKYGDVCSYCERHGSKRYPTNIDHIKPRRYFPELALDINNLQPLCGSCNKKKGNAF